MLIRKGILVLMLLFGSIFIAIELFLFLLMTKKSRMFYILYMLLDLAITVFFTIQIPKSSFVIFLLFSTIKDVLRVVLVKELYMPREFKRYCKMFNITINDFKKTRKVKKKKALVISFKGVKTTPTKKKSTSKKKEREATV